MKSEESGLVFVCVCGGMCDGDRDEDDKNKGYVFACGGM